MQKYTNHHYQSNKKRSSLLVLMFVLLVVATLGTIFYYRHNRTLDKQTQQKVQDEAQTNSAKNSIPQDTSSTKSTSVSNNDIKQNVPNSSSSVVITSFSEIDNVVQSSAQLSAGDGTCVFTYTPEGDKPVIDKVQSSSGECTSRLSANTFSRIGTYNLNVTVYINAKKTEVSRSVTIN